MYSPSHLQIRTCEPKTLSRAMVIGQAARSKFSNKVTNSLPQGGARLSCKPDAFSVAYCAPQGYLKIPDLFMSRSPEPEPISDTDATLCVARSVAKVLEENPALEAVTFKPDLQTISVATIGNTDVPSLTERIRSSVQRAQAADTEHSCTLLAGEGDCHTCAQPLSEFERKKITIQHDAGNTTIARITCPTAPKFWRWRDVPLPRVVQRDVEFLEHADEINEWKAQLVAAILCGVYGLGAYIFRAQPLSIAGFILAYLAGSWFTVQEVWERLQKRAIDVHFLMLAVAAGSASIGAWGEGTTLLFLFSLSGVLEHFALGRTQREIHSLFRDAPKVAVVLDDQGQEREMPVDRLRPEIRSWQGRSISGERWKRRCCDRPPKARSKKLST